MSTEIRHRVWLAAGTIGLAALLLSGCTVGPRYVPPTAPTAPAYKETSTSPTAPASQPLGQDWWKLFGDRELDVLEPQIQVSNQNLKIAAAEY